MLYTLIFHFGRSGSTVLQHAITRHPEIISLGEVFTERLEQANLPIEAPQDLVDTLLQSPKLQAAGPSVHTCYFELKPINTLHSKCAVDLDTAISTLAPVFSRVVILRRRNTLARMTSSLKARQSLVYHVPANKENARDRPVEIPVGDCTDYATGARAPTLGALLDATREREADICRDLERRFDDVTTLWYEDDVEQDPSRGLDKLAALAKVEPVPWEISLRRTSRGLAADIANYDAVRAELAGTAHAWMLDAPAPKEEGMWSELLRKIKRKARVER